MSAVSLFAQVFSLCWISLMTAQTCDQPYSLEASSFPQYLTSPRFPSNYPPSVSCQWTITASPGYVIEMTFVIFDTEGFINSRSSGCSFLDDNLVIYDGEDTWNGKELGKYCSNYLPPNVYSSGTSLLLKFKPVRYTQKQGFKIKYLAVLPKKDPSICTPFNTVFENNDIKYTGSSGYITSPLYGSNYPSNIQCTWVITVPDGKRVKLSFSDFQIVALSSQHASYCSSYEDHLEIRDGRFSTSSYLKRICHGQHPSPVYSTGRYMWIRFNSNSDNYMDNKAKTNGFKAKYEAAATITNVAGIVIGVIVAVVVVVVIIVIYFVMKRRRTRGYVNTPAQPPPTTINYNQYPQQMMGGGGAPSAQAGYPQAPPQAPPPSTGYPPSPQGSYPLSFQCSYQPPPGGNPIQPAGGAHPGTVGYPPQSSMPMGGYPSQTIPADPPPQYPADPPPQYPGLTPYPPQAPMAANQQAAPYAGPQGVDTKPLPYP